MTRMLILLALFASKAYAEPVVTPPGEESGRVDERDDSVSAGRRIARGALILPRYALKLAFFPIEKGVWAVERYDLAERLHRIFWNDANTVGLFPTAQVEAGFGLNIGAHLVVRDLFGHKERFDLRTSGGGRFNERVAASFETGRAGRVRVEAHGEFERRPKDVFFGIGNADAPMTLVADPIDDAGAQARFRHRLMRAITTVDVGITGALHARVSGSLSDHTFDRSDVAPSIDEVYDTSAITGFAGYRAGYSELELAWDTRRAATHWEPRSLPSTGGLLAAFGGRLHSFDGGPAMFRYGADAQRFLRIGEGPRTIVLRAHLEGITGSLSEVPFDQLPRLGGKDRLRGYQLDRFRDRVAAVGSIDYRWDLNRSMSASLFVDAGRVYRGLDEMTLDGLRTGYGVALEAHTEHNFLARVSLASSIDGGVFLDFALDPVFELDERVQRR
jgi:hypothetical protein